MACDFPITIKNPASKIDATAPQYIPVPCRKCPPCLAKRSNGWIFRLLQHDKVASTALFITLTYSNEAFTRQSGRITPKGYLTLYKRDFQLFMKQVRKAMPAPRKRTRNEPMTPLDYQNVIKYYAVGEYGSTTYRPHYHAIIFNVPREIIEQKWQHGSVHCDLVNGSTVAYTTKYMHKGKLIPVHQNDDRLPEFSLMSKGLGLSYITDEMAHYHQSDTSRNYVTGEGGVKIPMPAIYRQKLYTEAQRKAQARTVQDTVRSIEDKQQAAYAAIYGSTDGYYRSQAESKRSALTIFRERQRSRNKI